MINAKRVLLLNRVRFLFGILRKTQLTDVFVPKMGHATITADTVKEAIAKADLVKKYLQVKSC